MPVRKNLSSKRSKSRKYSKLSKKNYSKIQKGGAYEYFFFLEGYPRNMYGTWISSVRPYQTDAMNRAAVNGEGKYDYDDKQGIKFTMVLLYHLTENNEYVFQMIREDGTIAYFKRIGHRESGLGDRMGNMGGVYGLPK